METALTPERARELFERLRRFSGADELEATLQYGVSDLTRFANNVIHQNVSEEGLSISVRAVASGRTARASTNRADNGSLRRVVEQAEALARLQAPDPDLLPMPGPQAVPPVDRFDSATAALTPAARAEKVAEMVAIAREHRLVSAGVMANHRGVLAMYNSRGLEAYYSETGAEYSVTMQAEDSSGWAKANAVAIAGLDPVAGARSAAEKAAASAHPRDLPAGRYTVILEPAAVLDLLGFLFWDFGGLAVLDQRSFLVDRLGTQLFGANIQIDDDAYHPLQTGAPFDGEGVARQRLTLVDRGRIAHLVYARQTARQIQAQHPDWQAAPTGHGFPLPNEYGEAPTNIVVHGGDSSVERMIASTERGILVTRLWYIREVDPYQKILTGMTRDGTFLVENGKLGAGLRNFRFNQNMVELLNRVEALGPAVRSSGEESFDMVVPAMKVSGFNFTEVTRF